MTRHDRDHWWFRAGLVLFIATMIFAFERAGSPPNRDAFASFQPELELFPAAPVADAVTTFGAGEPESWPYSPSGCDMGMGSFDYHVDFGDWTTVRHDWGDGKQARSWIVSESLTTFDDFDKYDEYIARYRNAVDFCGWDYTRTIHDGFNSVLIELDGMPTGSFAFTIDASPELTPDYPYFFGDSNPDDFHALGAVLPGRQRGVVMFVMWIGWSVEVPADEFVATANSLFDAAHEHARTDGANARGETDNSDDALIAIEPSRFDFEGAGVLPLLDPPPDDYSSSYRNGIVQLHKCGFPGLDDIVDESIDRARDSDVDVSTSGYSFAKEEREVSFGTVQWESSSIYSEAVGRSSTKISTPCIDSRQHRVFLIEPLTVPGMPAGSVVARTYRDIEDGGTNETLVAVLSEDVSHKLMIIEWNEPGRQVPNDDFVAAANQAWQSYLAGES